jgi:hypothetical protein
MLRTMSSTPSNADRHRSPDRRPSQSVVGARLFIEQVDRNLSGLGAVTQLAQADREQLTHTLAAIGWITTDADA